MNILAEIFDFFLPRICPGCGNKLTVAERTICPVCLNKIKLAREERLCREYERKFRAKKIISGFTSLYVFEEGKEFQNIIHSLKYNGRFAVGVFLGKQLGNHIANMMNEWHIDIIIPIPLHQLKKAERGYNQSFYIAKGLGSVLNIPVKQNIVKRKRFTQSQTTMNLKEREENIRDAFLIRNSKGLSGKNILLIDDVITTGATISECGRILLEAGASRIYAASTAIAD
ncbi:MAG: ComF family protein [Ignavibacteriaceae bacterium]|nr:ComF family protein [Ignavibacteriaceae bacterium]